MRWKPSTYTRTQMEERRREGGRLIKAGKLSQAEIARRLGVSRMTVSEWARRVATGGRRQLWSRKASGCPPKLTRPQQRELKRAVKRGARAAGFSTDRWTLKRIQRLIKCLFHVTYHPNYLNRLLRRLGLSPQMPLPRAIERDPKRVKAWLEHDWPRIKKRARRNRATIVFYDEFGFSFLEPLGRTWAPKGKRPIVRRVTAERRVLSTAVGMTLSGKIYRRHFDDSIDSDGVIEVLEHLQRHIPGTILLIWDRAKAHTSKKTQAYLAHHPNLIVESLPAYAPETNPEEYCHGNIKHHLRNATPADKQEVQRMVDQGFARLRRRPDLLLSFVHAAGLSVRQLWLN